MERKSSNSKFAALLAKTCCALIYQQMYCFFGFFPQHKGWIIDEAWFHIPIVCAGEKAACCSTRRAGCFACRAVYCAFQGLLFFLVSGASMEKLMVASAVEAAVLPTLCPRGNVLQGFFFSSFFLFFSFSFFFFFSFFFLPHNRVWMRRSKGKIWRIKERWMFHS